MYCICIACTIEILPSRFSVDPGDLDIPVGCVIRAFPGSIRRDGLDVERIEQINASLTLDDNEELVSHIVSLKFDPDVQVEQWFMGTHY